MTNIHITRENLDLLQNLPADTTVLRCIGLGLTELPPNLPPGLQVLDCSDNQITNLPNLPPGLRILDCSCNQLAQLLNLPPALTILLFADNQLAQLSDLPPALRKLDCFNNTQLANLPDLPETLHELICDEPLRTLYDFQNGDTKYIIQEKVNQWNAANLWQQDYVLK